MNKTTLTEFADFVKNSNSASGKIILKDDDGQVIGAFIYVNGQPETNEILEAVESVEAIWEASYNDEDDEDSENWGFDEEDE